MKNATKGALAAAAAGSLLLGGAGSLAYWTTSKPVTAGDITSGTLTLTAAGAQACTGWKFSGGPSDGSLLGSELIVPGDTIKQVCTYKVGATGKNIKATLTASAPSYNTGNNTNLSDELTPTASYKWTHTVAGSPTVSDVTQTQASDGLNVSNNDTIEATLTVVFNSLSDNAEASQNATAKLKDITVTAAQVAP